MLTAVGHGMNRELAERVGAAAYVVKPFNIKELTNKINELYKED